MFVRVLLGWEICFGMLISFAYDSFYVGIFPVLVHYFVVFLVVEIVHHGERLLFGLQLLAPSASPVGPSTSIK